MNLFVTGTDTDVGKTFVTAGLVRALRALGRDAVALKPIVSGFEASPAGRKNADIEALRSAADGVISAADLHVYGFDPAIAPHRAAELAGIEIQLQPICQSHARAVQAHQDVLVEGAGGWAVPLSASLMLADMVRALQLPVLLVVAVRLGCINHALLSAQAIVAAGLPLLGWVANDIDPGMSQAQASIEAIAARINAPLIGRIEQNAGERAFKALAGTLLAVCGEP